MNPYVWLGLPWKMKLATLVAGVFFGQRFDAIGHNPIIPGLRIVGTARQPRIIRVGGDKCPA